MTFFESSSRSILLFEHDLFGKPVPTFPDHALGVEDHYKDGETLSALSQLKATDRRQDKPPRKQPEQKRNNLRAETGQHGALVGHQPSIPCLRDIRCRDVQDCMLKSEL